MSSDKKRLQQRLAAAKRQAKRRTVTVKKHTRRAYSIPSSLWRVNQTFNIEERILALAKSVQRSSRLKEDFVCVAILQDALNQLRNSLQ